MTFESKSRKLFARNSLRQFARVFPVFGLQSGLGVRMLIATFQLIFATHTGCVWQTIGFREPGMFSSIGKFHLK